MRGIARLALATSIAAALLAPSVATAADRRVVPEVIDLPVGRAQADLTAFGFRVRLASVAGEPAGTVARQSPGGFTWAEIGTEVTLDVRGPAGPGVSDPVSSPPGTGSGPARPLPPPPAGLVIPRVVGKTEMEALEALKDWRVTLTTVDSTQGSEGRVVDQHPSAGTALAAGQVVTISIGRAGAPPAGAAVVPNVVGLPSEAAVAAVEAARLVPLVNVVASDAAAAGRAVSQEPAGGVIVARDSNVVVNVGRPAATTLLETEVPDLRRLSEAEARSRLIAAGLVASVRDRLSSAEDANLVVEQVPPAGARVQRDSIVTVTVGRVLLLPIRLPDVLNREAAEAERMLHDIGFIVERVTALSLPGSAGRVVAQDPTGGGSATRGSVVRITVGSSPTLAGNVVPDVSGMAEPDAVQRLRALGFTLGRAVVAGSPAEAGLVRGTQPSAGTVVPRGGQVTLVVVEGGASAGVPLALPSYVGLDVGSAQMDLAARGLTAAVTYVPTLPEGRVIAQAPPAGTPLARGATVTLTVSRAPTLGTVVLTSPPDRTAQPKNYGAVFTWSAVPDAEEYEFEIFKEKDDTWVVAGRETERVPMKRALTMKAGRYQWHVRARRTNGAIVGPWSEWRRLTVY